MVEPGFEQMIRRSRLRSEGAIGNGGNELMAADYDLVVVGGGATARYVAEQAAGRGARVALVVDDPEGDRLRMLAEAGQQRLLQALHLQTQAWQQGIEVTLPSLAMLQEDGIRLPLDWGGRSLAGLAVLGVDVVEGTAEFCRRTQVAVVGAGRLLRSRSYLIATDTEDPVLTYPGLETCAYWTRRALWQARSEDLLPTSSPWIVLGDDPTTLALAQGIQRLGQSVLLICSGSLLPQEDGDLVNYLAAYLSAEGLQVISNARVQQIAQTSTGQVQVTLQTIQQDKMTYVGDRLIVGGTSPRLRSLNLQAAGIAATSQGLVVNRTLQTSHPKVFACGAVLGGYDQPRIAQAEGDAVLNYLLGGGDPLPHYHTLPVDVGTSPRLVRVGLTEQQARLRYGEDVQVLTHPYLGEDVPIFTKIVLRPNGQILGGHWLGDAIAEAEILSVALRHHLPLQSLRLPPRSGLAYIYQMWINQCRERSLLAKLRQQWLTWQRDWGWRP